MQKQQEQANRTYLITSNREFRSIWRSFESCRALVLLIPLLSLSYSFSLSFLSSAAIWEGEFVQLGWKLRWTHEGGARRDASLLILFSLNKYSTTQSNIRFSLLSIILLKKHTQSLDWLKAGAHSNWLNCTRISLKYRRDVNHRCADKGAFS